MNKKIFKELFILILLLAIVIFTIGILFYDFISFKSKEANIIVYAASNDVKNVINEISNPINNKEILGTYQIGENQLNNEKKEVSYETGKKDPFSTYLSDETQIIQTTSTEANVNNAQLSKSEEGNAEENKVSNTTTPGTFFEKPNMK